MERRKTEMLTFISCPLEQKSGFVVETKNGGNFFVVLWENKKKSSFSVVLKNWCRNNSANGILLFCGMAMVNQPVPV